MDKTDRLLDAIEHPDHYTDREIEAMLADPEIKEIYDLLGKTKSSLTPIATPDIEAEWAAFERTHNQRKRHILNLFSRNVAAGIAIVAASLAAVAAVVGIGVGYMREKKDEIPATEMAAVAKEVIEIGDTISVAEKIVADSPEIIIFDNEPLDTIASHITEYYGYRAEFGSDSSKSLRLYFRWNQALTLEEVVESLNNFEQIHIAVNEDTIKID